MFSHQVHPTEPDSLSARPIFLMLHVESAPNSQKVIITLPTTQHPEKQITDLAPFASEQVPPPESSPVSLISFWQLLSE